MDPRLTTTPLLWPLFLAPVLSHFLILQPPYSYHFVITTTFSWPEGGHINGFHVELFERALHQILTNKFILSLLSSLIFRNNDCLAQCCFKPLRSLEQSHTWYGYVSPLKEKQPCAK